MSCRNARAGSTAAARLRICGLYADACPERRLARLFLRPIVRRSRRAWLGKEPIRGEETGDAIRDAIREDADENQRRVEGVFAELAETQPDNVSYIVLRLADDRSCTCPSTTTETTR